MIVDDFTRYAEGCRTMGSDLYARLLTAARDDLVAGGPVADVVAGWDDSSFEDAVPLRLMGGVHRLVLTGRAPELARHYPSTGGTPGPDAEEAFLAAVAGDVPYLRQGMEHPPQTNEVNRCGLLLAGFLVAARRLGPSLRILEIGSSAGLNQRFDRYRYHLGVGAWGPDSARVHIDTEWRDIEAVAPVPLQVADRRGCDPMPLDVTDDDAMLRLRSFIWADQVERLVRLEAAIADAREDPPQVDEAKAEDWLHGLIGKEGPPPVLVHSFMFQYLDEESRAAVDEAFREAAGPRARVSVEGGIEGYEVRIGFEPDGDDLLLGTGHPHGRWMQFTEQGRAALA